MKTCTMCKLEKELTEFVKKSSSKDGYAGHCSGCHKIKYVAGKRREQHLKRRYGLTLADYDRMLEEQNVACAICQEPKVYNLHVDHCHTTNKVRGLLCAQCNRAIGLLRDNTESVARLATYLAA